MFKLQYGSERVTSVHATTRVIDKLRTMKIGVQGSFYPRPASSTGKDILHWQLEESARLGCTVLQPALLSLPEDRAKLSEFARHAGSLGMELELAAPGAVSVAGPLADAEARTRFVQELEKAAYLGVPVVRTAYGRLNVSTSRFNPNLGIEQHLRLLVPALKEAGRMADHYGLLLAVENHCDFTGKELATLLELVDSPQVGAALDTANGYTVFCDPNEDVKTLAPYTFTTHMKDMQIVNFKQGGCIPMIPQGCILGEGHVDLRRALELLAEQSPCADGLHLIVEPGWMNWDPERDQEEQEFEYFKQSIGYLKAILEG